MPCQACKEFKEKHVRYKVETIGNPSDYAVACTSTAKGMPCPNGGLACGSSTQCPQGTCPPPWDCPAPPKTHSHFASSTCVGVIGITCKYCRITCREIGSCVYSGWCYYDCDVGYHWDGSNCVPDVAIGIVHGNLYIPLVLMYCYSRYVYGKKRKKKILKTFIQ